MASVHSLLACGVLGLAIVLGGCSEDLTTHPGPTVELAKGGGKPAPPPSGPADPAITFVDGDRLLVMNVDGEHQTVLTTFSGEVAWPAWGPDGASIAFNGPGCCYQLSRIDVSVVDGVPVGTNHQLLVDTTTGFPTWAPDGQSIVVHGLSVAGPSLLAVPAAGGGSTALHTAAPGDRLHFADYSPDGARIAYAHGIGSPVNAVNELEVLDLGTGVVTTLVADGAVDALLGEADWSADGTRIAFTASVPSGRRTVLQLHTVNVATGVVTPLGVDGRSPSWSPDGSQIVFEALGRSGRSDGIRVLTLATGAIAELARSGRFPDWKK